jgi:ankyrin repeat protein
MPREVFCLILSHLSVVDESQSRRVSRLFVAYRISESRFKQKLRLHFPHVEEQITQDDTLSYQEHYKKAYGEEYGQLSKRMKACFNAVKDAAHQQVGYALPTLLTGLTYVELLVCDSRGLGLIDWVVKSANQTLNRFVYQLVMQQYKTGPTVNAIKRDVLGNTALHWAIYLNQGEYAADLVSRPETEINAFNKSGRTALYFAVVSGNADMCSWLIQHGSAVSQADDQGLTPFMHGVSYGFKQVFNVLLTTLKGDYQSAQAAQDRKREDAVVNELEMGLELAIKGGKSGMAVAVLCSGFIDLEAVNSAGQTFLHLAALEGLNEVVRLMLVMEAAVDTGSTTGETALFSAVRAQHETVVSSLLQAKASPNSVLDCGTTVLHESAKHESHMIVRDLLTHKAEVDRTQPFDITALHLAAHKGREKIAQELLCCDLQLDFPREDGMTALHIAAVAGHTKIVALLLTCGAKLTSSGDRGRHALDLPVSEDMGTLLKRAQVSRAHTAKCAASIGTQSGAFKLYVSKRRRRRGSPLQDGGKRLSVRSVTPN